MLLDVVWDVGKIGKVAPVAVLEPVFVGGTTVQRATLANQEVIRARDVRIGDTVLVRRAGDVIPYVSGPLDPSRRTGQEREIVAPTHCPSCGEPLVEQGNSRELYCVNVVCPAQTVRRLIHWASRAAADIEAIGPKWIERLNEAGLLDRPSDFYALQRDRLLEFDGVGEVSADRMVASIEGSKDVGLRRALIGFAIPMASDGVAAKLCRHGFASLEEVAGASVEALSAVEGVGEKVALSIEEHLNRDTAKAEIARLRELGVGLDVHAEDLPPEVVGGSPLEGRSVVITGALADPRSGEKVARPVFQRLVEKAGATTTTSVSASTDLLVTGADVGAAKLAKAEKHGVEVVDQAEVWKLLIDAGIA
jgi:DNA ligase (NAD+)